jgi:selenocysteine-specific translation elongation factor
MTEKNIGKITHFFDHISVAAIKLTDSLSVGDAILIKGHTTNITQDVDSMQIDNQSVEKAKAGDEIGLKVKGKVRANDDVYIVI